MLVSALIVWMMEMVFEWQCLASCQDTGREVTFEFTNIEDPEEKH